jgi:hypothetical protein
MVPTTMQDRHAGPSPRRLKMRFYNQQHQFYCGIDLHARSMFTHILDQQGVFDVICPLRRGDAVTFGIDPVALTRRRAARRGFWGAA